MDYDYVNKLSDEEKQWLADFTNEYYNADVGKQVDKGRDTRFQKTAKDVQDCQNRNNIRNRDMYGKAKAHRKINTIEYKGMMDYFDKRSDYSVNETEDMMVELLDRSENLNNSSSDTDQ